MRLRRDFLSNGLQPQPEPLPDRDLASDRWFVQSPSQFCFGIFFRSLHGERCPSPFPLPVSANTVPDFIRARRTLSDVAFAPHLLRSSELNLILQSSEQNRASFRRPTPILNGS